MKELIGLMLDEEFFQHKKLEELEADETTGLKGVRNKLDAVYQELSNADAGA